MSWRKGMSHAQRGNPQLKHTLFQRNIWNEHNYDRFIQAFEDRGANVEMAEVVPFTVNIVRQQDNVPDLTFGSNRIISLCRERGYPVFKTFLPIEDSFYAPEHWINGSGHWCNWGELDITSPKFLKPRTEKFFTGCVVESQEDLEKVQLSTSFIPEPDDELVWVCEPVHIGQEIRFFVIGGRIITGSYYRINGQARQARVDSTHEAWRDLQEILRAGFIDDAFAIDLGLIDSRWKIIEINNANSAGIYATDVDALASAYLYL